MPSFQVDQKYTYSGSKEQFKFAGWDTSSSQNTPVDYEDNGIIVADIDYPTRGTTQRQRTKDKLYVSSIHWKGTIKKSAKLSRKNLDTSSTTDQIPYDMMQFFKFRMFVVRWKNLEGVSVPKYDLLAWFKRTYIYTGTDANNPPSVHERMMRMSTEYTGKFDILMDRPFIFPAKRDQLDFEFIIPVKDRFCFNEESEQLVSPAISIFIMSPLNRFTDIDTYTADEMHKWVITADPIVTFWYSGIIKLNFMDL